MSRWLLFVLSAILGVGLLLCGLLVPAHLRAVDERVLQKAGRKTPTLVAQGLALVTENKLGAAELVHQAAQQQGLLGHERLGEAVAKLAEEHPGWQAWGGGDFLLGALVEPNSALEAAPNPGTNGTQPFTEWMIRTGNREKVLTLLRSSSRPAVQELLQGRELTNTVIFSPSQSSAGQALDAAVAVCGLLLEANRLTPGLSHALHDVTAQASGLGHSQALEEVLLDCLALGQRLNWGQLETFVEHIQEPSTLHALTHFMRGDEKQLPLVFSAVDLSGHPEAVAHYLQNFSRSGLPDVAAGLKYGAGGLNELLRRNERLYHSELRQRLSAAPAVAAAVNAAAEYSWRAPAWALAAKWFLYVVGGFLLAAALHFTWPPVPALERPLQVRGFHVAREVLFALGFLLAVLLLSEPFLAQESQRAEFPFRLSLSAVGRAVAPGSAGAKPSIMNQVSLLTLLLFFVLQGLIYIACVVKLAEIRRQQVPTRLKLKLLENEDHLFDAGLYLGFVGTIVSLILVSLNIITFSLMAAYSSTSFGIIFVSFFKIFHLRPLRRRLLLEAELGQPEPEAPVSARLAPTT